MNRIELPKRSARRRKAREQRPAQLELTLELPREHAPAQKTPAAQEAERGVAMVDFYI